LVSLEKSKNMKKTFYLPKYYQIEIEIETGEVNIYSNSKHAKGRLLSKSINNNGYLSVKMNNKTYSIHSLVAKFILGERPSGLCVNHIDGNKLNNAPSNLEYVTIAENTKHSMRMGLHIGNRPELINSYKDGRTRNKIQYKHDWYIQNRQKVLERVKNNYYAKKQQQQQQQQQQQHKNE
jgi:hypothetical protein